MELIIDNYDSFSYNLYQYVGEINSDVKVIKNDELSVEEIAALNAAHIIISPGPGRPKDAGVSEAVVRTLSGKTPILGVCLGHQAICEAFGAEIVYAAQLVHGKARETFLAGGCPLFKGLKPIIDVGRYHSLAVRASSLPDCLLVTAEDEEGEIMGVRHREYPVFGLQFHPESVLTEGGKTIIANFLAM